MKWLLSSVLPFAFFACIAQPAKNVFIITMDGVRWQEIFNGADREILNNSKYVKDTSLMLRQFWSSDTLQNRQKLLPFFWSVIANDGLLMGNRTFNNKVNVANFYKISYPGYAEIFTGYADLLFIPNLAIYNRHTNVLNYLNQQPDYRGKVAAFCSWELMPFILNEQDSAALVNAGYENIMNAAGFDTTINKVQDEVNVKGKTRHDLLTYEYARNYIEQQHPRVMYLGLGESDEFAHKGHYDAYLQKIHQADAFIADLWYYVQTDPFYKDNTTFIITTDHGRGRKKNNWITHGFWIAGSGETWLAMLGAGVKAEGEAKVRQQVYQKQLAATIAQILGLTFKVAHPVCEPLPLPFCSAFSANSVTAISSK